MEYDDLKGQRSRSPGRSGWLFKSPLAGGGGILWRPHYRPHILFPFCIRCTSSHGLFPCCIRCMSSHGLFPCCIRCMSSHGLFPVCIRCMSSHGLFPCCIRCMSSHGLFPVCIRCMSSHGLFPCCIRCMSSHGLFWKMAANGYKTVCWRSSPVGNGCPLFWVKDKFFSCHSAKCRPIWMKSGRDVLLRGIHLWVQFDPDRCMGRFRTKTTLFLL